MNLVLYALFVVSVLCVFITLAAALAVVFVLMRRAAFRSLDRPDQPLALVGLSYLPSPGRESCGILRVGDVGEP